MIDLLYSYGAAMSMDLLSHHGDIKTAAAIFAANPALVDNAGALANAAGNGNEAFVRLMLHYNPDLVKRISVGAKTRALTEFLFQHGMDPNRRNWLGETPLHQFAREGKLDRATIFLDHGADINARDEDICSTPLGSAAKFGKKAMVEFLLRRGAKPNLPDDPTWATPLAWATRRGHQEIVELLNEYEKTGSLPPLPPEPEQSADPITGTWKDERGIVFELKLEGDREVSGMVSPNGGAIKKGTFDSKTGELKLEIDARRQDGKIYDLVIEGKVDKRIATGTFTFRPVEEDITGDFKVVKQ